MPRSSYDVVGNLFDHITFTYLDAVDAAPPGNPVEFNGRQTTDVDLRLWQEYQTSLETMFAEHGWTMAEFDEAINLRGSGTTPPP